VGNYRLRSHASALGRAVGLRGGSHSKAFLFIVSEALEQHLIRGIVDGLHFAWPRVEQAKVICPRYPTAEMPGELRGGGRQSHLQAPSAAPAAL
jgi:hypothetical protein